MSDDPFTLDLFGSSALSTGLGITGFGGFAPEAANDDEPDPTPSPPSSIAVVPSIQSKARMRGHIANFYLQGDRGLAAAWKERAEMNVAAILLASEIERQERPARPDEHASIAISAAMPRIGRSGPARN